MHVSLPADMDLNTYLDLRKREFYLTADALRSVAADFVRAMESGLAGRPSSLRMLPSFLGSPSGREHDSVIAIDFGGTNIRVLEVELDGNGGVVTKRILRAPLVDPAGAYDHLGAGSNAEGLFGFIADRVAEIARPGVSYDLGHTFSFPCRQTGVNEARLIFWTKEIRTAGVEGEDVGQLLDRALASRGLSQVRSRAILNDTVGTLLAAAFTRPHVAIGSICGTGHNTCYLEPVHPLTGRPMIVNMESGNFDAAPQTRFDRELDEASERPGTQRLEKMGSGRYIGEIVRRVLIDMAAEGLLPVSAGLSRRDVLSGPEVGAILADGAGLEATAATLASCFGWVSLGDERLAAVRTVVGLLVERSARLTAATFCGTLLHIDPPLSGEHVIAVDGSLYEKMPYYAGWIQQAIDETLPAARGRVGTMLAKDGSGIGAAIAAATAAALEV